MKRRLLVLSLAVTHNPSLLWHYFISMAVKVSVEIQNRHYSGWNWQHSFSLPVFMNVAGGEQLRVPQLLPGMGLLLTMAIPVLRRSLQEFLEIQVNRYGRGMDEVKKNNA